MGRLVDYRISDRIASPDDSEFSEALVRLPGAHFMFNDQQPIAESAPSRQQCGLPDDSFVFCVFNSGFKIEPIVFGVWMELLRRVPHSVLWLRDDAPALKDNLRREAASRGISAERLVFAPWMERTAHLARHACADLFLDTLFCNAHTTATDALWAGLPVLTCAGDTMASRFAASIVTAAGLPELVVDSLDDYLALALRLARHPDELAGLRRRLRASRDELPVFSTASRVRYLEQAFESMWQRHCRGEPPRSFSIETESLRSRDSCAIAGC
jgi:predicted O-linked N-acetylglucosamine transferase (SPINDLY family)